MSTRFSASGQHYTSTLGMPTGTAFTMMCWAWISVDRNDWSCMLAYENALSGAGRWYELVTDSNGTSPIFSTSGGVIPMGTATVGAWNFLAVGVSGSTGSVWYGTDPGSLATGTGPVDGIATVVPTHFFVGTDSFGEWFNGRIACARVFNALLTGPEVAAEAGSYDAVRTANLLRNHRLQAPSTADDSGLGRTLTGGTGASTEADPPITVPSLALPARPVVSTAAAHRAVW